MKDEQIFYLIITVFIVMVVAVVFTNIRIDNTLKKLPILEQNSSYNNITFKCIEYNTKEVFKYNNTCLFRKTNYTQYSDTKDCLLIEEKNGLWTIRGDPTWISSTPAVLIVNDTCYKYEVYGK